MKKRIKELLRQTWFAYTVATCTAVFLYWLLSHLHFIPIILEYLSPVLWGILIAYVINPLVNYFEGRVFHRIKKENNKHILSVVASLIIVLVLIVLLFTAFVPPIVESVSGIANNIDFYGEKAREYIDFVNQIAKRMNIDVSDISNTMEDLAQGVVSSVTENSISIVKSFFDVGTGIVNVGIGVVIAIYFLIDKKKLIGGINKIRRLFLSEEAYKRNNQIWKKCNTILSRFLIYDILDGFIVGIINMIFMLICHMPYVALISVIVGLFNLIPTIGPIIGAVIGGILLVMTDPISALLFIIFTVILQIIDGSFLKPRMFGDSFGVPSVWIFIAIVLGGKLLGIIGIVLAIPVAAIFTYILNEIIFPYLEKRKEEA